VQAPTTISSRDLIVLYTRTVRVGPQSFRVSAPTIWNELLPHRKDTDTSRGQFKAGLKTWRFECAYRWRRLWEHPFKRRLTNL